MKTTYLKTYAAILLGIATVAAGCSGEEPDKGPGYELSTDEIMPRAGMYTVTADAWDGEPQRNDSTANDSVADGTRAVFESDAFSSAGQFGVFAYKSSSTTPVYTETVLYNQVPNVKDGNNYSWSDHRYYPAGDVWTHFYAYYPVSGATVNSFESITYSMTGQTDIMWAKADDAKAVNRKRSEYPHQPTLTFQHLLHRLKFKFVSDVYYFQTTAVTKVKITNVYTNFTLNAKTGKLSITNGTTTSYETPTFSCKATTSGVTCSESILIQEITGNGTTKYNFAITIGGKEHTVAVDLPNPLKAGETTTITFTLKGVLIEPTVNWGWNVNSDEGSPTNRKDITIIN